MKCKNCEAELDEGVTLCPECGCDNAPAEEAAPVPAEEVTAVTEPAQTEQMPTEDNGQEPTSVKKGMTPGKIALIAVLIVAAIAVVVALIVSGLNSGDADEDATTSTAETVEATVPADGNPDDVTCKGTYTVSDEDVVKAADTVVATMGDRELTNSELQTYYWMQFYDFMSSYGSYAAYFGLDYTQPLDTQLSMDGTTTWQQYFLDSALSSWQMYNALAAEAEENGFEMDAEYAEYLAAMDESLQSSAESAGFESVEAMLQADMGVGADTEGYKAYMNAYYTGYLFYNEQCNAVEVTDADIEAYFDENAETYAENGIEKNDDSYVDVRHILVMPEGGTTDDDGNVTYSDEEWETCRASAQAILDEWLAGDATEDTFAELANTYSEDTGSNTNGGLYEDVYVGEMVEPFENWCFDSSRVYGDYGLVQTDYGYHVMYFVGSTPVWFTTAESDLFDAKYDQIIEDAMAKHEMVVDYSAIELGFVDFSVE